LAVLPQPRRSSVNWSTAKPPQATSTVAASTAAAKNSASSHAPCACNDSQPATPALATATMPAASSHCPRRMSVRERRRAVPAGRRQRSTAGAHRKRSAQGSMNSALRPTSCSDAPACRSSTGSDCMAMVVTSVCVT